MRPSVQDEIVTFLVASNESDSEDEITCLLPEKYVLQAHDSDSDELIAAEEPTVKNEAQSMKSPLSKLPTQK